MIAALFAALADLAAETGQFGLELPRIHPISFHHGSDHGIRQE